MNPPHDLNGRNIDLASNKQDSKMRVFYFGTFDLGVLGDLPLAINICDSSFDLEGHTFQLKIPGVLLFLSKK